MAKNKRTDILLENMREGIYHFSAWLEDDELDKSLATDFTGTFYGDTVPELSVKSFHCF